MRSALSAVGFFFLALRLSADTTLTPAQQAIAMRSHAVISGTIQRNRIREGETTTEVRVEEVIKGAIAEGTVIEVIEPGGVAGGAGTVVPDAPQFREGDRVLLMLRSTAAGRWSVTDLARGSFLLGSDRQPVSLAVTNTPTSYTLLVDANSGYGARWFCSSGGGCAVAGRDELIDVENAQPGAPNGGVDALTTAADAWSAKCAGISVIISRPQFSGNSHILFEQDLSSLGIAPYSCQSGGVLGVTKVFLKSDGNATNTVGGETLMTIDRAEISMNAGIGACLANNTLSLNTFTVALSHQIGHTLGFRHSDQTRTNDPNVICSSDPSLECASNSLMASNGDTSPAVTTPALGTWELHAVHVLYPAYYQCGRAFDFDGDKIGDVSIFRPEQGGWHVLQSKTNSGAATLGFGTAPGDIPVPADYDDDGITDIAIFRPSDGSWHIMQSFDGVAVRIIWGAPGDVPVQADYDGDGKADVAIFRNGDWHVRMSSSGSGFLWATHFGTNPGDVPVPGRYDGGGAIVPAIFRPSDATWHVHDGQKYPFVFGSSGDLPVPADYDGDGAIDPATFTPGAGTWKIKQSSDGMIVTTTWGSGPTDKPVPGDYDGDGKTDIAIFRDGDWHIKRSSDGMGMLISGFGTAPGDIPLPIRTMTVSIGR